MATYIGVSVMYLHQTTVKCHKSHFTRETMIDCRSLSGTETLSRPDWSYPDPQIVSRPNGPSPWAEGRWGETQGRDLISGVALTVRNSDSVRGRS